MVIKNLNDFNETILFTEEEKYNILELADFAKAQYILMVYDKTKKCDYLVYIDRRIDYMDIVS